MGEIKQVFSFPAPYSIKNGVRYQASTGKLIDKSFFIHVTYPDNSVKVFSSINDCAIYIKVSPVTLSKYIRSGDSYKGIKFVISSSPM
jgi:hypothetical protein